MSVSVQVCMCVWVSQFDIGFIIFIAPLCT